MIRTLQSLRFVFIMLIVLSHIMGKMFDFGGECGVSFFFILSGFVLSVGYAEKIHKGLFRQKQFLLKQIFKFYPLHIVMLCVMVLLDARIGQRIEWYKLLPNILLVQSWIPKEDISFYANGVAWFLCDILFLYLIFRLLFQQLFSVSLKYLLTGSFCVLIFYLVFAYTIPINAINSLLYVFPLTRTIDFSIGILLYRFYISEKGKIFRLWLAEKDTFILTVMEILMIIGLVVLFFIYSCCPLPIRCGCLFWCYLPFFIYFFIEADKFCGVITQRVLQHPVMLWLGAISFEIYMMQMLAIRIGYNLISKTSDGIWSYMTVWTFVIFMLIFISWLVKKFFVDKVYKIGFIYTK